MIKTGIYGGSFNPVHNGHIALAHELRQLAGLDEIWFVVSPQNPLKTQASLLDDRKRLDMTRRALEPYPELVASNYEFALPRPSYMWHTLQSLSARYPDREFTLIIGADNWACFDRWYHAADIIAHYPIVRLVDTPLYNISSTEVREDVRAGRDISAKVPSSIVDDVMRFYK